jgi:hypothetical protein
VYLNRFRKANDPPQLLRQLVVVALDSPWFVELELVCDKLLFMEQVESNEINKLEQGR